MSKPKYKYTVRLKLGQGWTEEVVIADTRETGKNTMIFIKNERRVYVCSLVSLIDIKISDVPTNMTDEEFLETIIPDYKQNKEHPVLRDEHPTVLPQEHK